MAHGSTRSLSAYAQRGWLWGKVKFLDIYREAGKFGIIGLLALIVDVGTFNILRMSDMFADRPLTAKVIAVLLATTFAYMGNRWWTFRDRQRTNPAREYILFVLLNGVAMLIAVSCLWFSHYALGLTSVLADNISANVVGLALGTVFRFWSYRKWVFLAPEASTPTVSAASAPDEAPTRV